MKLELRDAKAALQAMAHNGLITLPARKGTTPTPRWKPVTISGKPLSQTIIEDRDDRA